MAGHISQADAESQRLPGYDVFRASHLIYHDEVNRDGGIYQLCLEAFYAFSDSIMISERYALAREQRQDEIYVSGSDFGTGRPPDAPVTHKWLRFLNLEHLKIASAFEITLKSLLVEKGIVIQEISRSDGSYKDLADRQKKVPIYARELFEIDGYRFDGLANYLPGVTRNSLSFRTIISEPDYRDALGISDIDLKLIDEFRNLRNEIHFPADAVSTPIRAAHPVPIAEFLLQFINRWVIGRANLIHDRRGIGSEWPLLV